MDVSSDQVAAFFQWTAFLIHCVVVVWTLRDMIRYHGKYDKWLLQIHTAFLAYGVGVFYLIAEVIFMELPAHGGRYAVLTVVGLMAIRALMNGIRPPISLPGGTRPPDDTVL